MVCVWGCGECCIACHDVYVCTRKDTLNESWIQYLGLIQGKKQNYKINDNYNDSTGRGCIIYFRLGIWAGETSGN